MVNSKLRDLLEVSGFTLENGEKVYGSVAVTRYTYAPISKFATPTKIKVGKQYVQKLLNK